jgi:hypothetical protein
MLPTCCQHSQLSRLHPPPLPLLENYYHVCLCCVCHPAVARDDLVVVVVPAAAVIEDGGDRSSGGGEVGTDAPPRCIIDPTVARGASGVM